MMMMHARQARQLLGVGPGASRAQIEAAFRAEARKAHPDAGGSGASFARLVEARAALGGGLGAGRGVPTTSRATTRWARRRRRLARRLRRLRGERRVA